MGLKILLVGDYSRVFLTLKEGLEKLGNEVVLISKGDLWKKYPQDINIRGDNSKQVLKRILKNLPSLTNYDIVQLVNPVFFFSGQSSVKLNGIFYGYLKLFNKKTFLSAIGDDYIWVANCLKGIYKYSPINNSNNRNEGHYKLANRRMLGSYKSLNESIAHNVRNIIAGLYEYYIAYQNSQYRNKLAFVPFPVNTDIIEYKVESKKSKITFMLGKQKNRVFWKGMDTLENTFLEYKRKYPNDIELIIVDSIPYNEYTGYLKGADVLVDQLYSYSPAMNALTAMAMGKIVMGGGEREMYELMGEKDNFPIINITPYYNDIANKVSYLLDNRSKIQEMKFQSRLFVEKHHNYQKVAGEYLEVWKS